MERDEVGPTPQVVKRCHAFDPELERLFRSQEWVETDDGHTERQRPFGDRQSDASQADDCERFSFELTAGELVSLPLAGFETIVCLGDVPRQVIFTGYGPDEDLPALYSGARAFVYPSLYEGFGLPVLEALATGTQVIAANTTSIPEVAGPSTFLVDPESIHEIAAAMDGALRHTADLTALARGLSHARLYTWDSSAAQTEKLLLTYC